MFFNEFQYEIVTFIYTCILLSIYILVFIKITVHYRKKIISNEQLLSNATRIDNRLLYVLIFIYVIFKIYILDRYGLEGIYAIAFQKETNIPYSLLSINSIVTYPALGAFVVLLIKIGKNIKFILHPLPLISGILYFIFFILFNEISGARRIFIFLLIFLFLIWIHERKYRPTFKILFVVILLLFLGNAFSDYYQKIRGNMGNRYINSLMLSGGENIFEGIYLFITESSPEYYSTAENLRVRYSPFWVIYQINYAQMTNFNFTYGSIIAQSIENVIPSFLYPSKKVINADKMLSDEYNLIVDDLPSGVLSMFQSDLLFIGFVITPIIYILLFLLYNRIMRMYFNNDFIFITIISLLLLTSFHVESLFDSMLVNLRDFLTILVLTALILRLKEVLNVRRN